MSAAGSCGCPGMTPNAVRPRADDCEVPAGEKRLPPGTSRVRLHPTCQRSARLSFVYAQPAFLAREEKDVFSEHADHGRRAVDSERHCGLSCRASHSSCNARLAFAIEGVEWGPRRIPAGGKAIGRESHTNPPAGIRWGHPLVVQTPILLLASDGSSLVECLRQEGVPGCAASMRLRRARYTLWPARSAATSHAGGRPVPQDAEKGRP